MSSAELGGIIASSTTLLERALHSEEDNRFSPELQLRGSVCDLATGALEAYVRRVYGLELDRRMAIPDKAPRGVNSRLLRHAVLFTDSEMIDPSYSQFFEYVGLNRTEVMNNPRLARFYPVAKVAIIDTARSDEFAALIAEHAHTIEPKVIRLRGDSQLALPPLDSLVGTDLDEKERVFHDIWNPANYDVPLPVADQSPSFQRRVAKITRKMMQLEEQR
jgi:hypothetical protein